MFEIFPELTLEEVKELADIITNEDRETYGYKDKTSKEEILNFPILKWLADRFECSCDSIQYREEIKKTKNMTIEQFLERKSLERTADYFKILYTDNMPNERIEKKIMDRFIKKIENQIQKMNPTDREKFAENMEKAIKKEFSKKGIQITAGVVSTSILAGELSGFGIYMATSTGLKALSLALGTTFSFATYMTASKILSVFLGPIGWALSGALTLEAIFSWIVKDNWRRLITFVISCIAKKNDLELVKTNKKV